MLGGLDQQHRGGHGSFSVEHHPNANALFILYRNEAEAAIAGGL
jgi:hypothetical protein